MLHHPYFLRGVGARRVAAAPRSSFHCWTQRQHHCSYYHRYHCWVGSSSSGVSSTTEAAATTTTTQRRTSTTPQQRNNYGSNSSTAAAAAATPPHYRYYHQQYYYRSFSISRHPDPLTRHGTINSLDDDDDDTSTTTDGDLDGGLSRGGKKKVVLTADDMDYLDEFLGLDQLVSSSSSSSSTKNKKGGTSAKTKGRGMDYNNLFSSIDNDDDDDDIVGHSSLRTSRNKNNKGGGTTMSSEEIANAEYQRKQQAIHDELDTRTGRLWTESWTITDEEWMADETWEDIEEWKPSLATRKSLESVRVYNNNTPATTTTNDDDHGGGVRGVPTLTVLSTLALPTTLPPHPGHGVPSIHATHRKKTIMRQLRTSIQIVIQEDILKIMNHMSTYDERQAAVDVLYETIHDKVREREPVLCKLPNFGQLVNEGLEDVLSMVQESMTRQAKVEKQKKTKKKGMIMKTTELDNEIATATATTTTTTTNGVKSVQTEGKDIQKQPLIVVDENIIDVMGVNIEPPIPIFMDILAATRHLHTLQQEYKQYDDNSSSSSTPPPPPRIIPPPTTNTFFATTNDVNVPNLLYPLTNHPKMGVGRMVEEWQLAANKETKRIMIRDAMKEISSIVVNATTVTTTKEGVPQQQQQSSSDDDDVVGDSTTSTEVMSTTTTTGGGGGGATRILVTGKRGVGKTAALAGFVASARLSGHIVVYHPDGDRLRKHGYYIEPCPYRTGLYNLPEIAKEFCDQLLKSHGEDLQSSDFVNDVVVTRDEMVTFFSEDQIRRLFRRAYTEEVAAGILTEDDVSKMTHMKLVDILTVGVNSTVLSSGCYTCVISKLMTQTIRPFTVVMDEYNCYYDHGHYFHMDYDDSVRKAIPPNLITIFKPFMDAMGLYPTKSGTDVNIKTEMAVDPNEALMKFGSLVVATSESRAVRDTFTQSLEDCARNVSTHKVHVVDVRRYSNVEVQHALYNFEITGIGRLRFDRGETALNPEEVEYLRLVSGGCGQRLLDSCMLP